MLDLAAAKALGFPTPWDRSDSMTDYYNERFAKDVRIEEDTGAWQKIEAAKVAQARAAEGGV
jgi:hypothetical protein